MYSDRFFTFTCGNLVLDYINELFLKHDNRHPNDILESATCEMPKDTQRHNLGSTASILSQIRARARCAPDSRGWQAQGQQLKCISGVTVRKGS